MRVVVTGGAGFIGSHLCEALLGRGDSVVCVDSFDLHYPKRYKLSNLEEIQARGADFRFVEGDIRGLETWDGVAGLGPADAVVHLAARAGVRESLGDPHAYFDVNVGGTIRVLDFCVRNGVGKIVFASSSSVYGDRRDVPFRESDPTDRPVSPYAASKRTGELLCYTYHALHGIAASCLRFFTVYGPRQRPEMAIHKFARLLIEGQEIPMFGNGSIARDYTYVSDVVDGIQRALDKAEGYSVFNLGDSRPHTLAELVQTIAAAAGVPARVRALPDQPGDVPVTFADIGHAAAALGYQPRVSLSDGVGRFVEWYRRVGQALAKGAEAEKA